MHKNLKVTEVCKLSEMTALFERCISELSNMMCESCLNASPSLFFLCPSFLCVQDGALRRGERERRGEGVGRDSAAVQIDECSGLG